MVLQMSNIAEEGGTLTALKPETMTIQWSTAVLTDCNAVTCYNRIVLAKTSSQSHKIELPEYI